MNEDDMVEEPSGREERLVDEIADAMEDEEERELEELGELERALRGTQATPVEEEVEEELAQEDLEQDLDESLDVTLERTMVGERDSEESDQFVCRSCFHVRQRTQLADEERLLCTDCAEPPRRRGTA